MSDFTKIGSFPHQCPGDGCAICALIQRRKAKAAAKLPKWKVSAAAQRKSGS